MKISNDTISILKSFSSINNGINIEAGSEIKTISEGKNIFASATVAEEFPVEFAIYDLGSFLGAISLLKDADFEFEENRVILSSGKSKIYYNYTNKETITVPTKKIKTDDNSLFEFDLPAEVLSSISKASGVLNAPFLALEARDGEVVLRVYDPKDSSVNNYSYTVPDVVAEQNYQIFLKIENIKLLAGNYRVSVKSFKEAIAVFFENSDLNVKYFIAPEKNGTKEQ